MLILVPLTIKTNRALVIPVPNLTRSNIGFT
jgi:hypothetical protein